MSNQNLMQVLKPAIIKDNNLDRAFKWWCLNEDPALREAQEVSFTTCMNNWNWGKVLNDLSQEQMDAIKTYILGQHAEHLKYYFESEKPIPSSFMRWEKEAFRKIKLIVERKKQ